ncbi:putative 11-oxo-beta-amyrin 30-oxidase [Helianthus annuus]|nr:putative 11-oxo-beta-amyrin 30-oxidase [Helianthus annuus]
MIFNEVLRLYPPVVSIPRMIHQETKAGDITLPPGSMIRLHNMLVHHDRDIWGDDVKEFKPERFYDGVSKVTKGQVSYFPFGGGPRICIGLNFAMLESKMALTMILQHFRFDISPSYSHAPHSVVTLQPQFGAHLILRKL